MAVSKTFSDFLHKHPLPVIFFDLKSKAITYANPSAAVFFGHSAARLTNLFLSNILGFTGKLPAKTPVHSVAHIRKGERPRVLVYFRTLGHGAGKKGILIIEPVASVETGQGAEIFSEALAEINQPVILFSAALAIHFANRAAVNKLGYTEMELHGRQLNELFRFPDEMALRVLVDSLCRTNATPLDLQIKFVRKDGTQFETEVHLKRLKTGSYFLMTTTGVTGKLTVEKKFQNALREKENAGKRSAPPCEEQSSADFVDAVPEALGCGAGGDAEIS